MEALLLPEVAGKQRDHYPTYTGNRFYCDWCQYVFRNSQLVAVAGDFIFCATASQGNLRDDCMSRWLHHHDRVVMDFVTMRFHGNT